MNSGHPVQKSKCGASAVTGYCSFKHLASTFTIAEPGIFLQNPIAVKAPSGTNSDSLTYEIADDRSDVPLPPSTTNWEVKREQVTIIKVIGKGAFSQVAKAIARNIRGNQEDTTVAVKMLKGRRIRFVFYGISVTSPIVGIVSKETGAASVGN